MTKFSQNDPLWKREKMGRSNLTIGNFGCTTSCVCDGGSYFGETKTPRYLASFKQLYTAGGLIIWKYIEQIYTHMKFMYRYYSFNEGVIDEYLVRNPNTVVLLNVDRGYHWVFALRKVTGGYECSDPWPFPSKNRVYHHDDVEGFSVLIRK
jgi:hypothetical protein